MMKRPRSYGEDLDYEPGEKAVFKDWARRDQDSDRPSSHRRFYPKPDSHRKGSSPSSYDRSLDDDRRKPVEHEPDGLSRRKGFGRYRDGGGDRDAPVSSSPRSSGDRTHWSESFSPFRREFPKGFRSERDRSRREVSSGSSWRRSSVRKEATGELSPSANSDQGKVRSRDSSSTGEKSRRADREKVVKGHKESCSSSEMEEGELEPDPEPETVAEPENDTKSMIGLEPENCKDRENDCKAVSEASSDNKEILSSERKSGCDGEGARNGNEKVTDCQNDNNSAQKLNGRRIGGGEREDEEQHEGNLGWNKQEIVEEPKCQGEEGVVEEGKGVSFCASSPLETKMADAQGEGRGVEAEVEAQRKEDADVDFKVEQEEGRGIDLEAEPEGNEITIESIRDEDALKFFTDKPEENHKDKGKSLVASLSGKEDSMEDENAMEGTSGRGFELLFPSAVIRPEQANSGGIVLGKHKDEKLKLEPLDLSLGLPSYHTCTNPNANHNSPSRARSIQSVPSSFRTMSEGFTTSISFSNSQPFAHNPSCSLTQNSLENYEHSVGSHPIFQGVDQVSNATVWQAQSSNEPKRKGGCGALFQRVLLNGNQAHNSLHTLNGQHHSKPDGLSRQPSLRRQLSPSHSHGSHDTWSENSKDKKLLTRESSSSSLLRSEQQGGEQGGLNGVGVVERILVKIVREPLQVMSMMLHEMTRHSVAYLKETICEMVAYSDKHGKWHQLQEALQRRSDLTIETMSKCPRILLEILVALKTGLPDFLRRTDNIPSSDLIEIFLNLKCRNLACRSILPVDECDCRFCVRKDGFCRECMCLVCSKFDLASNTCSWVGCDVCLHWCHTDCGLRESHIRNGRSASGTQGLTEMQFHCIACDHPSEMFGFVKEVFKTYAKEWGAENLAKELQYVRRIFSSSNDVKGKRLCGLADQMLTKLDDKANLSGVINYVMEFFSESDININKGPSTLPAKAPSRNDSEGVNMIARPSKEATWSPSHSTGKASRLNNIGVLSSMDRDRLGRQTRDSKLQLNPEKKPVVDELESVARFKQAEAKMYQERADDARREAEGLKRIAVAKNARIDEDYSAQIAKLRLGEAEERRKQKIEELQVIERMHREYFNMKMRMEADIKDLLLKMEATKPNFIT